MSLPPPTVSIGSVTGPSHTQALGLRTSIHRRGFYRLERLRGFEPLLRVWKTRVLPLNTIAADLQKLAYASNEVLNKG